MKKILTTVFVAGALGLTAMNASAAFVPDYGAANDYDLFASRYIMAFDNFMDDPVVTKITITGRAATMMFDLDYRGFQGSITIGSADSSENWDPRYGGLSTEKGSLYVSNSTVVGNVSAYGNVTISNYRPTAQSHYSGYNITGDVSANTATYASTITADKVKTILPVTSTISGTATIDKTVGPTLGIYETSMYLKGYATTLSQMAATGNSDVSCVKTTCLASLTGSGASDLEIFTLDATAIGNTGTSNFTIDNIAAGATILLNIDATTTGASANNLFNLLSSLTDNKVIYNFYNAKNINVYSYTGSSVDIIGDILVPNGNFIASGDVHVAGKVMADVIQLRDRTTFEGVGVTAVPEPSEYAMMGMGLLLVGLIARRRIGS